MRSINKLISDTLSHYVTCALWSSTNDDGSPMDDANGSDDIAPAALAQMRSEVRDFIRYTMRQNLFTQYPGDCAQLGHDFWLTRNGHGAGFWDRGHGKIGDQMSAAAKTFGSSDLYVGDDGMIYVS